MIRILGFSILNLICLTNPRPLRHAPPNLALVTLDCGLWTADRGLWPLAFSLPTLAPPPPQPPGRVADGVNFALLALVDRADRNEPNLQFRPNECQQYLGFDFKMARRNCQTVPRCQIHQPKPALRIRQPAPRRSRQTPAHPTIHLSPYPGHRARIGHPIPDNQHGTALLRAPEKPRNVLWRMLSVSIQAQCPGEPTLQRPTPPRSQSRAFSPRYLLPQDLSSGGLCDYACCVARTVVHDHNRANLLPNPFNQRTNAGGLV